MRLELQLLALRLTATGRAFQWVNAPNLSCSYSGSITI